MVFTQIKINPLFTTQRPVLLNFIEYSISFVKNNVKPSLRKQATHNKQKEAKVVD